MKRYLTAIVLGLAATTAIADGGEQGWNAGIAGSFAEYSFDSSRIDDNSGGVKVFGGYRFNKWLGAEAAYYYFGDFTGDLTPGESGGNAKVELDGVAGSALIYAPLDFDNVDVYGKLGYYAFSQDVKVDGGSTGSYSNSPDGLLAGAGARLRVNSAFALLMEAEYYDISDGSLWAINVGASYLFGGASKAATVAAAPPPPAAAPEPAPVVVPPPPADSDGDGVPDPADECPGTPAGAKVDARGCEEEIVLRGVTFETNSATLTPQDELILDSVAEILAKRPAFNVEVRGHTDNTGSEQYNLNLSQERANAVREYLVGKGIAADKLTAVGVGESEPVASNDTEDGRSQNRRVTLEFTEGK